MRRRRPTTRRSAASCWAASAAVLATVGLIVGCSGPSPTTPARPVSSIPGRATAGADPGGSVPAASPPSTSPSATPTAAPTSTPAATTTTPTAAPPTIPAAVAPAPPPAIGPEVTRLAARLDGVLVNTNSCLIVEDAATRTLYAHNPDVALAPASTQKLVVAAAALDRLGPNFRFETTVVAAAPAKGGAVPEVWLVGGGDPVLYSPEFAAAVAPSARFRGNPWTPLSTLVDTLAFEGIHSIGPGGIHGDDFRYDRLRFLPDWPAAYVAEADIAPLGALEVDGGLQAWTPKAVLAANPAVHASAVLARRLNARGIAAAAASETRAPAGAVVLARVQSAPLSQLVAGMLSSSNNLTAEQLVRELDHQAGGAGTTAAGTRIVAAEAAKLGLPVAGLGLIDGSGLAPANRATCRLLLAALDLGDQPAFAPLATGLSVAGQSGTLAGRFAGTGAAGRLLAKTGSIGGVAALVGRYTLPQPLRFAFITNGELTFAVGAALEDRIVAALGTYPEGS